MDGIFRITDLNGFCFRVFSVVDGKLGFGNSYTSHRSGLVNGASENIQNGLRESQRFPVSVESKTNLRHRANLEVVYSLNVGKSVVVDERYRKRNIDRSFHYKSRFTGIGFLPCRVFGDQLYALRKDHAFYRGSLP